jgi:hypothetical protein
MGIFNFFRKNTLSNKIEIAEREIKRIVQEELKGKENVKILKYGAYDIDPKYLVIWITVESDEVKSQLERNGILNKQLRDLLVKVGYPEKSIDEVKIGFESEETVNRESNGDWYLHFK